MGVVAYGALAAFARERPAFALIVLIAVGAASAFVEFGPLGVATVPAVAWLALIS